jgi:C1A family cysteine protease
MMDTLNRPSKHGGYGWVPQIADQRDYQFLPKLAQQNVPSSFLCDVTDIPVLNQGQQGSCTGHGVAGVLMFDQKKQELEIVVPSREFIYYNARVYEGTQDQDSGAMVRDAVKVVVNLGAPPDDDFPYDDQVYDRKPPNKAYTDATLEKAVTYEAVSYGHLHAAIATGYPMVFGFSVYESFESEEVAQTGVVPIPERGERVLGGHCVWGYGYNGSHTLTQNGMPPRTVKCRNSWDTDWGDNGDFYLPQWFFDKQQCSDYWVINSIS